MTAETQGDAEIAQRSRAAIKSDPRTHTMQHQIKIFWGFGFRDNSCDFVDRYVPSKLCSNNKKFRNCFAEKPGTALY